MTLERRALRSRSPARIGGMTLMEVMVALAVLSLLSAGMVAAFRVGHRTYDRLVQADRSYWDVVVAQRFLRDTLEAAYPFEPGGSSAAAGAGLDGSAERLSVTAPGSLADNATGFRRFSFSLMRRADGFDDLVATSSLDRNGSAASDLSQTPDAETIIARVKGVEWGYLDTGKGTVWQSSWAERRPPSLVRLRVFFPKGDARRWPDLIVAPRITDDANCQFDVVAQACRESQS